MRWLAIPSLGCMVVAMACGGPRGAPAEPARPQRGSEVATPAAPAQPRKAAGEPAAAAEVPPARSAVGGEGGAPAAEVPAAWTAGIVDQPSDGTGIAVLAAVRTASHDGFDRVVFELAGAWPGYHLEYVDRPVRRCGSGDVVPLPGDAWLEIRLEPAAAHDEAGRATVAERDRLLALGTALRLVLTCDFEAVVTWVLAVDAPQPYRVHRLEEPRRLVVELRH